MALWAPTALAHHKDDHNNGNRNSDARDHDGDADSDSGTVYTEDNDTNDGDTPDNVSDDGDNAHPSGKDRSVEGGNSGNQGNSESNPDDSKGPMRYEGELGADKPNGPGGTDLADQDGNNGCGNDDDFDDDNNGWCGKPTDDESDDEVDEVEVEGEIIVDKLCPENPIMDLVPGCSDGDNDGDSGDEVGADLEENPATPDTEVDDSVLGTRVTAAPEVAAAAVAPAAVSAAPEAAGAVLPFTGSSDLLPFVALALMLMGIGALSLRARRSNA
jgi:hypothetical protein